MSRHSALSPSETFILRQWGETLRRAFGATAYHVGSSFGVGRAAEFPYRDVDVRIMLDDDDPLLADPNRWVAINVALSCWGRQVTGLPIDCQLQATSVGNSEKHVGPRNPLRNVPVESYLEVPEGYSYTPAEDLA